MTKTSNLAALKEGKVRTADLDCKATTSEIAEAIVAKLKT